MNVFWLAFFLICLHQNFSKECQIGEYEENGECYNCGSFRTTISFGSQSPNSCICVTTHYGENGIDTQCKECPKNSRRINLQESSLKSDCICEDGFFKIDNECIQEEIFLPKQVEESYSCFGIDSSNSSSCSGQGVCASENYCECYFYYTGSNCDSFNYSAIGNVTIGLVITFLVFIFIVAVCTGVIFHGISKLFERKRISDPKERKNNYELRTINQDDHVSIDRQPKGFRDNNIHVGIDEMIRTPMARMRKKRKYQRPPPKKVFGQEKETIEIEIKNNETVEKKENQDKQIKFVSENIEDTKKEEVVVSKDQPKTRERRKSVKMMVEEKEKTIKNLKAKTKEPEEEPIKGRNSIKDRMESMENKRKIIKKNQPRLKRGQSANNIGVKKPKKEHVQVRRKSVKVGISHRKTKPAPPPINKKAVKKRSNSQTKKETKAVVKPQKEEIVGRKSFGEKKRSSSLNGSPKKKKPKERFRKYSIDQVKLRKQKGTTGRVKFLAEETEKRRKKEAPKIPKKRKNSVVVMREMLESSNTPVSKTISVPPSIPSKRKRKMSLKIMREEMLRNETPDRKMY